MEKKHKVYLKLNLMSLFFIAVSFISVTLAWFAYSGLTSVSSEFGVKAWYIEFKKNGVGETSNNIDVSTQNIYPGMETVNEFVNINNEGDSDAQLNYKIVSARILDTEYVVGESLTSEKLEDMLSHDYPFHVNVNLSKKYVASKGEASVFDVSISWPLDSDTDQLDSEWGNRAYEFQKREKQLNGDNARPSIQIVIEVNAEQYIETTYTNSDMKYNLGDLILYDVSKNHGCTEVGGSCIVTHVIDVNSTLEDIEVHLLPDIYKTYPKTTFDNYKATLDSMFNGSTANNWNVNYTELSANTLMNIISTDIMDSLLIREKLSDSIIGNLSFPDRISTELLKATTPRNIGGINYYGSYIFKSSTFDYLVSNKCYWTNTTFNNAASTAFAFKKYNENNGIIYGESNSTLCSVIPVLKVHKANIERTTD